MRIPTNLKNFSRSNWGSKIAKIDMNLSPTEIDQIAAIADEVTDVVTEIVEDLEEQVDIYEKEYNNAFSKQEILEAEKRDLKKLSDGLTKILNDGTLYETYMGLWEKLDAIVSEAIERSGAAADELRHIDMEVLTYEDHLAGLQSDFEEFSMLEKQLLKLDDSIKGLSVFADVIGNALSDGILSNRLSNHINRRTLRELELLLSKAN